ncbi:hypothetical protein RclHR1_02720016 [Rhizophagus clarus]|uniref:Uncharacterized protein n=1 Tax=Rhizophagus clarus TaxID=94130 RepID=A0A2Z6RHD2_9GLOM|nr:hypothetical protein RclHR1_02720016 [Rhizophagus clarus]
MWGYISSSYPTFVDSIFILLFCRLLSLKVTFFENHFIFSRDSKTYTVKVNSKYKHAIKKKTLSYKIHII